MLADLPLVRIKGLWGSLIEKIMGKRRILEIYLNIIEWGEGIFGIEAAADYYFKKNAFSINQKQAAVLAAIIPNPVYYGKNIKSLRIRKKIAILYARMKSAKPPL